jgi:hypothetical protein
MLYLEPNNEVFTDMMPGGDMTAVRAGTGLQTQLLSYGMADVSLTDNAGNALQLKDGTSSQLTFPIPSGMESNPPATIPLWYFDEERGIWIEEGTASLQGNIYVGTVEHFSWHNLDVPGERVTIRGKVTDCEDKPVSYVKVTVDQTAAVTDSKGEYSVYVPAATPVTVTVKSKEYGYYAPEVSHNVAGKSGGAVVTQDLKLPCITQEPGDNSVFTINAASITYLMNGTEAIITFDNFGKRMRWDMNYGTEDHAVILFNELTGTYSFGIAGFWIDQPYEGQSVGVIFGGFVYDEAIYSQIPGFTVMPNETIAGKSCTVFTYTDAEEGCTVKIGTWNGLLLLVDDCEEGVAMAATDVNLNVPANAFTKTMDVF